MKSGVLRVDGARVLLDRVFAFDELPAAQAHMENNQHLGKIVLKISE